MRHHEQFRMRFDIDVGTYQIIKRNTQLENRIMGVLHGAATGVLARIRDEIGLKDRRQAIPFLKARDLQYDEEIQNLPDMSALHTALFLPIDMTEYEEQWVGQGDFGRTFEAPAMPYFL